MISKKSILTIAVIACVLVVIVVIGAYNLYTKPHRSVENEKGIVITAVQLFNDFEINESEAEKKYLDKTVEVKGEVAEVSTNREGKQVILLKTENLMFGVQCTMTKEWPGIKPTDSIIIKGICKGFLSDVIVTDGVIKE